MDGGKILGTTGGVIHPEALQDSEVHRPMEQSASILNPVITAVRADVGKQERTA
jgi:hypothetical protein